MNKQSLISVFALAALIWAVFGAEIDITAPEATTTENNTPDLNVTFNEGVNVTYSWDSEGNISGCRNCTSFNTTYGENNGSDANLNLLFHFNENFGNTTYDDASYDNDGTLGNATAGTQPAWTSGQFGHALEFDGSDDFVNVTDDPTIRISQNITVMAWVKPKGTGSWRTILKKGQNGVMNYKMQITTNSLEFSVDTVEYGGKSVISSPTIVENGVWTHVVGTYDNATLKVYINGTEMASAQVNGSLIDTDSQDLTIGWDINQNTWFNGTIDEVAIYNRSFSGAEIREFYNKTLSNGSHCVTVYANDSAGGLNSTERCFTVGTAIPTTITIDSPANDTISDTTPDLDFTVNESSNVTYSWDSEGNISGCRNCTSFNTVYGENNGSDVKLNLLLHFNENFSNTAFDDTSNGNDGTLGNATAGTQPAWTDGKFGPALEFDSVNDFVNVSDSSSLDFTDSLTMAAWVYPRFTSWPGYTGVVSKDASYALGMSAGKLRISLYNGSKWSNTDSSDNVSFDQWVHIAGTFNGTWTRLYINGAEVKSQAVSAGWGSSITTTNNPLQVGYYPGFTYFNGTIDEVAVYNRTLSGAEIQEMYSKSFPDGSHCVTVYANDSAGNLNSTKRCFTVDAPPTITISTPTDATTSDTTPDLNFTVDELANMTYSWDSEGNISGCRNCTSFNTVYGENNGSDVKLNLLLHFNENFSNTAFDDTSNSNDGTLGNATAGTQPAWTTGKFGPALEFDSVNDFVNVSDSSSLDFTDSLTMVAWVYPRFTSWPSFTGVIGKNVTYALVVVNGKLRISLYNGTTWSFINSPDNVSFDQWVHIAGTFNGTWTRLYINGAEVKSQAVSAGWGSSITTTNNPLQVGYYPGFTYFNGTIDEVAVYNRTLSGAEIQDLYAKSLSQGYHCVTVYANDSAGNLNSKTKCFTVSVLVPVKILAGTNRFSVWAPYENVINYEADESSFKFRAGALVVDQNGEPISGENVTFEVNSPSMLKATITNTTNANGIAYMVYSTMGDFTVSGDTDYGTWRVVVLSSDTSVNTTRTLQIDDYGFPGCSMGRDLCHNDPTDAALTGTSPKSPYSDEFGASTGTYASIGSGAHRRSNHNGESCELCHSGYGTGSGAADPAYPWGAHTNINCKNVNCHGTSVFSSFPPNMPSCYDCHPNNNANLSTVDTTVTVNSIPDATVYSWNHEQKAPLMAHTTDQTYNMSKGIPCWICHGPMHNITKPDPAPANTNTYTEASQCTTCHSPKAEHNDQVNCTVCHSQDAHNISFFNTTGNYINDSSSAGDCTTCHQQTTAWNTLLTQSKAGSYSGSGPPQVPVPLNHSDNVTGQRWGSYWTESNDLAACNYCHGDTKHSAAALGRPANWNGSNTVNSSINATNNWCAGCHYQLYSSGGDSYSDMPSEFTIDGFSVPPEITSDSTYAPTGTAGYFNHSLGDYSDKTCSYCHDGLASSATNITAFVHNVGTGKRCENCHFSWSKMNSTFSKPIAYMNETRFTNSVHGTSSVFPSVIFCTSCHTTISNGTDYHLSINPSVFTPPQSGWKWCEDCHMVNQSAPVSNRHNLTDNPATNMFNSTTSVMEVTDCTTCHNATMYDAAVQSYNKTSGKDCRFCHAFPDLLPGGD